MAKTGTMVSPAALAACCRLVEREWGDTGYSIGVANGGSVGAVCEVAHFDGSRFYVWSTRWENTGHADTYDKAHADCMDRVNIEREALAR